MLHAPRPMLTPDVLQSSHPGVMIRPKLAKAYRQRLLICAVTFHFSHSRPVKGEAYFTGLTSYPA